MDVNGTKFHLLYGQGDWGQCVPQGGDQTLSDLWASPDEADKPALEWNYDENNLRLTREMPLFRPSVYLLGDLPLDLRRGAGRDRYGHWYWIAPDEHGIRFLANGERHSVSFWTAAEQAAACEVNALDGFTACPPQTPPDVLLRGLAVTNRHYLVVGDVTEHGILVFDLHRGGPPVLLRWPDDVPFVPWDMVAAPDGGVLILDRDNQQYWKLDSQFRLMAGVSQAPGLFQPVEGSPAPPNVKRPVVQPVGYPLDVDGQTVADPISIETGPDGHVLILDAPSDQPSTVLEYYEESGVRVAHRYTLEVVVAVTEGSESLFQVSAHDFAYAECCVPDPLDPAAMAASQSCACLDLQLVDRGPGTLRLLYVAEREGNQVIVYEMRRDPLDLEPQPDFLPLRRWEGKGLVAAGSRVYYDFADRWVPLQVLVECYYRTQAIITTPIDFQPDLPGQPFDSNEIGCKWHRLFLDAEIPVGTRVAIRARAADDPELLPYANWLDQPSLYLRSGGPELPFFDPYAARRGDPNLTNRAGTWELLFQEVLGRYLQLEITVEGTGRSTPELSALRVWYPRFSYLEHYLPAVYSEDRVSAFFLERWLANFEGFYTDLEDKIDGLPQLLDPATAPVDALDWLACWFGLALDPLWTEERRRFFIRHAYALFTRRGTVPGLEIALRIYLDCKVDDSLFEPKNWGTGKVRIVELYLLRGVSGAVYGDPSAGATSAVDPAESAHRFSVLVPHDLSAEDELMVERIVLLEKPAHTAFDLKRYWDLFRVGEARLGIDTQIGYSSYVSALVLGDSYLADGYLAAAYPFDIEDRIVSDRDTLGDLPPL